MEDSVQVSTNKNLTNFSNLSPVNIEFQDLSFAVPQGRKGEDENDFDIFSTFTWEYRCVQPFFADICLFFEKKTEWINDQFEVIIIFILKLKLSK